MANIVIDPVTRIEGHLRIETEVSNGQVTNAWSTSPLVRGIEPILQNRDPRDANDVSGPVETALVGTPVADQTKPLEVLRTIHSFNPCIACAVHVFDPKSNSTFEVKAQ